MGDDLSISVQTGNQNRQLRSASHVFVHPEYNLYTYDHNVAVVRVSLSFSASTTFNPVSRPQDSPPANTQCAIAGWGNIFHVNCFHCNYIHFLDEIIIFLSQEGPISFQLLRMNSFVISRAICNSFNFYSGAVRGGMFCAGNNFQSTCQVRLGKYRICRFD